jgi:hypothetical protein
MVEEGMKSVYRKMQKNARLGGYGKGRSVNGVKKKRGDWLKRQLRGREKDCRESLRIDTTTPAIGRWHPGFFDLEEAQKSYITGPQSALATARIHSVPYPEAVPSPITIASRVRYRTRGRILIVPIFGSHVILLLLFPPPRSDTDNL